MTVFQITLALVGILSILIILLRAAEAIPGPEEPEATAEPFHYVTARGTSLPLGKAPDFPLEDVCTLIAQIDAWPETTTPAERS